MDVSQWDGFLDRWHRYFGKCVGAIYDRMGRPNWLDPDDISQQFLLRAVKIVKRMRRQEPNLTEQGLKRYLVGALYRLINRLIGEVYQGPQFFDGRHYTGRSNIVTSHVNACDAKMDCDDALQVLRADQRELLRELYGLDRTYKEIGEREGVTRQAIQQRAENARIRLIAGHGDRLTMARNQANRLRRAKENGK